MQAQSQRQAPDAPTRWRCRAAAPLPRHRPPHPHPGPPKGPKSREGLGSPAPRLPRVVEKWLGPHRPGQLGKILPRKLDHIPHPQDGAERGLVRVEAAGLHVGSSEIGKEVSPGQEERREARPSVNRKTGTHRFPSGLQEPQGRPSPRQGGPTPDLLDTCRLSHLCPCIFLVTPVPLTLSRGHKCSCLVPQTPRWGSLGACRETSPRDPLILSGRGQLGDWD